MAKRRRAASHTVEPDEALSDYVDTCVQVRYAETDQMGVAYYANHFIWFEVGRTDYIRRSGTTYREIEEQGGCYITVAEARCRYHAPVRYDDVLTVRTRLKSIRRRVLHFIYDVLAADGTKVATGETIHVVTDRQGKPRSLPAGYREALLAGGKTAT